MANVRPRDVAKGLKAKLNVAALTTTLGVTGFYTGIASPSVSRPYVRMQLLSAPDTNTFGARVYQEFVYLVEAVVDFDYESACSINDAIDLLLNRTSLTISNGTHDSTLRTQQIERPDVLQDGSVRWHVGGIYRVGVRC